MYHESRFNRPFGSMPHQDHLPNASQVRPILRLVPEPPSDEQSGVLFPASDVDSRYETYRTIIEHHASFPATLQGHLDRMVVQAGCEVEVSGQVPIGTKLEDREVDGEGVLALVYGRDSPTVGTLHERGRLALLGQDRFTAYDDDERINKIAANRLVEAGLGSTQTFATETSLYYAYITGLKALGEPYVLVNDMRCHVVSASDLDFDQVIAYGSAQLRLAGESRIVTSQKTMNNEDTLESDVNVINSEKVLQWSPLSGFIINQAFELKTPEVDDDEPLARVIQIQDMLERQAARAQVKSHALLSK